MTTQQLQGKAALLESKVDWLETELDQLNALLKKCGFPEGVKSLKVAVGEFLKDKDVL